MNVRLASIVAFLAVTSDALRLTSKHSDRHTKLDRMQWWQPAVKDAPLKDKYVLFSMDAGGLNNIRLGWEFAGIIAKRSNRTLVLPPPAPMYLLDNGPGAGLYQKDFLDMRHETFGRGSKTAIEDLINLKQLKGHLATLTWAEFQAKTGKDFGSAKKQAKSMSFVNECDKLDEALVVAAHEEMIFLDGSRRKPFDCTEWWLQGGPRENLRRTFHDQNWALLTHGFVWHPDAFEIASKVVNYLGLFQYNSLHARYGDLQFTESKEEPSSIFANWPSLKGGEKLYVASDAPEKFKSADNNVVVWNDFFSDKTGNLLASERAKYSKERFFKLNGLVEQLICTYAKLFVGTERSTFTGGIQRMRKEADTPNSTPRFHTKSSSATSDTKLSFERLPEDKGTIFLQLN